MPIPLHIATASDSGYFPGLEVLIASTLLHVQPDTPVYFHVFDGGISAADWGKLETLARRLHPHVSIEPIRFAKDRFAQFPALNGNHLTYARLLLGECLPEVERVVYLDSDILICKSPEELRDFDLQGKTALVMGDPTISTLDEDCPWLPPEQVKTYRYFNAGVLVLDLQRWRATDCQAKCFEALVTAPAKCSFHDQTTLNYVLREDVLFTDQTWNVFAYSSDALPRGIANFHIGGEKPWLTYRPRFDHYLWRAFYRDVISAKFPWKPKTGSWLLFHLLRWPSNRWVFRLAMHVLINRSAHPHQRMMRERTLAHGGSDLRRILPIRQAWLAKHAKRLGA